MKEIKEIIKKYNLKCSVQDFINDVNEVQNKVNWIWISRYQTLSENFIEKFQDKVDWDWISKYQSLSESFIEKFQNKVSWYWISRDQSLSESFIEKFQNKVDWDYISAYQSLSESFIEKFQNKVNWDCISAYNKKIPIKKINNKYTSFHQIHKNINVYKNTYKNQRYLFLKGIEYKELNNYLIVYTNEK